MSNPLKPASPLQQPFKPSRAQAEAAVRTLIEWSGDDPMREGLLETPDRVVRAYEEFFSGYGQDPSKILVSSSYDAAGYDDMVVLRDIRFESHCEHHIIPIIGTIHLAYIPDRRVVGISKLARVCDVYAKRMQIQEALTTQIATAIDTALCPRGVAVVVDAAHGCMTTRGVYKPGMSMITRCFTGTFKHDAVVRGEFLSSLDLRGSDS
jgi:GTP cyclohydrolase I